MTAKGLPGAHDEREGSAGRLRAALDHVRRHRALRLLLLLQVGGFIVFTISIPVEVVLAQHTLHAGAGGYGTLLSAWGTGAVFGSIAYARWRRRTARTLLALSGAALAAGFIAMAASPTIAVAVAGAALGGFGNGIMVVATQTALQEYTERRWMALVMSLNQSITQAAPGIGILLGGLITTLFDPRVAFVVAGAGSLVYAITAWVVLRPSAMPEPVLEPELVPGGRWRPTERSPPRRPRAVRRSSSAYAGHCPRRSDLRTQRLRLGCIDIGSNTTRLLVADCDAERLGWIHQERAFTRLGHELFEHRERSDPRRSPKSSRWCAISATPPRGSGRPQSTPSRPRRCAARPTASTSCPLSSMRPG